MTRTVTIELEQEAVEAAEKAGLNLSELLAGALRRRLPDLESKKPAEKAQRWYEENREAVDAYNRVIEQDGFVFSDGTRSF